MYVAGEFSGIGVGIDEDCLVSALKEVAESIVPFVEPGRVTAVYMSHDL